ncbi:MAG: glycosyltransferase [Planctomycetota bacterium]
MKVLVVCPWVPWPLESGGKTRTYHLLREAARRVEIELFVVREPETDPAAAAALAAASASLAFFDRTPPGPGRRWARAKIERWFHSAPLRAAIRDRLGRGAVDLVHLDELLLARCVPPDARAPVVVHHHKLDTVLHAALAPRPGSARRFDGWKLRRLERYAARRFPHQVTCSLEDAALLRARYEALDLEVVPSGFDPAHFRPADPPPPRDPARLLFLGSMDYGPNEDGVSWFARAVLPALRARHPGTVLEVVGPHPGPALRALAGEGVAVVGRVPAVPERLERCGVFVVPLRIGGGTRLKLVEALAMGAPAVSTTIGAEGLGLADGEHILLADDPASFAAAVERLLANPRRAQELGRAGRAFVHARYRWETLAARLVAYWERVASSSR